MPTSLLDSQLESLEPADSETTTLAVISGRFEHDELPLGSDQVFLSPSKLTFQGTTASANCDGICEQSMPTGAYLPRQRCLAFALLILT